MEKGVENNFAFTWIIENFSMCHHPFKKRLFSLDFALNCLPRMTWCIELLPRGDSAENYLAVYLRRTDLIPETCNITYTIEGQNCQEKTVFNCGKFTSIFKANSGWGVPGCIKRDTLLQSLINDVLIMKFTLKPVCKESDQEILPPLPYKKEVFADVVLRASDAEFKVHKAVLWARWPKLVEKLDEEEICEKDFDIASEVLKAIIGYVYTGKLDYTESDPLEDIYTASEEFELLSLLCLPVVAQTARTRVNFKKISFKWPIKNFSGLPINTVLRSRILSVDISKSCKWYVKLNIREDAMHGRVFDISLCKVYDPEKRPVFVRCKISFDGNNSSENEHLFETEKSWKCADFSRAISVNQHDVLLLMLEFAFSDSTVFSEILESSCTEVPKIEDPFLNSHFRNLYESGMFSDISIIVDFEIFPAHKYVLCARSPVFSRMFETDVIESERNRVEISDIDPEIMDEFLLFIYTGSLKKSLEKTAEELYVVADKYDVLALKKKCSSFLSSNLTVQNVYRILQLASMHSDDDLYKNLLEFSCEHAEEMFSSDEWKEMAKTNFTVKLLQDIVLQRKLKK